jgi:hypothetical protein
METVSYMYIQHSRINQLIIRTWYNFINSIIYTAAQKHMISSLTLHLCALKVFLKSRKKIQSISVNKNGGTDNICACHDYMITRTTKRKPLYKQQQRNYTQRKKGQYIWHNINCIHAQMHASCETSEMNNKPL